VRGGEDRIYEQGQYIDSVHSVDRTRDDRKGYLETLERLNEETKMMEGLYCHMLDLYPTRLNSGALKVGGGRPTIMLKN
jgi:hypothetical protein